MELFSILPDDRGCRLQPNAPTAALVDKGALGGYAPDDIFGNQNRCHFAATMTRIFANNAICGVKRLETTALQFSRRDPRNRCLASPHPNAQPPPPHTPRAPLHA